MKEFLSSLVGVDTVEQQIDIAREKGGISSREEYTLNEPLVGYEYVRDCAALVHERGMVNMLVTNSTIEEVPWRELLPLIAAANIDLKGFTPEWY